MLEIITTMLPAVMGDALSAHGYLAAGTAGASIQYALQFLSRKRLERGRDVWIQEVGDGLKDLRDAGQQDELIAIIERYLRAAQEGTATTNLRLLARIIAGQKAFGSLKADEFLYYADILSSLRYEEIILLGTLHRLFNEELNQEKDIPLEKKDRNKAGSNAFNRAKQEMIGLGIFSNEDDYRATCEALTRTGLVFGQGTWDDIVRISPLMDRLSKLASFENLVKETVAA